MDIMNDFMNLFSDSVIEAPATLDIEVKQDIIPTPAPVAVADPAPVIMPPVVMLTTQTPAQTSEYFSEVKPMFDSIRADAADMGHIISNLEALLLDMQSDADVAVCDTQGALNTQNAKRFLTGGYAVFKVTDPSGVEMIYRINRQDSTQPFFASILRGDNPAKDYKYIGLFNPTTYAVKLTRKSVYRDIDKPVRVFNLAMEILSGKRSLPDGYTLAHVGQCGVCGQNLTTADSIASGIGAECAHKV